MYISKQKGDFTVLFLAPFTFFLSLLLSFSVRAISLNIGVVDLPDFRRKLHTSPVPRLGGVAFSLAFFTSIALKSVGGGGLHPLDSALLCAGGLSLLFGAADDFFDLSPLWKLCFQLICAVCASFILPQIYPFWLSIPFTVLMMNAYNFIDGLDGLSASISLTSLLFISLSSFIFLNTPIEITPILLFFAILGFLPLNVHPATLYMGESGSSTTGLSIALIILSMPAPLALLSLAFSLVPLFDTLLAVPRRILQGKSPFSADKGHFHHKLIALGMSHPAATTFLLLLANFLSILALTFALS